MTIARSSSKFIEVTIPQFVLYLLLCFVQNIIVDVLSMEHDLGLLQQGCDITGGLYLKIPQIHGLLQYLLVLLIFTIL